MLEKAEKNSKKVGLFRMVDELGRIVIPKEIRERYNLNEGDAIEIWLDGNKIILRKYHTECIYCRSKNNIEKVLEKPVCKSCLTKIKKNIINI